MLPPPDTPGSRGLRAVLSAWGPTAAWAGVLFALSASSSLGSLSVPVSDKVVHFALYAVLGATLAHGRVRAARRAPHWLLLVCGALYGVSDEWHQSFVPGRTPSAADWVADLLGVLLGYTLAVLLWNRDRTP